MPNLPFSTAAIATLVDSNIAARSSPPDPDSFAVICAWPVSGQYGPGSRILYYVLVAACVLGRGSAWLRGACLAAALLLPAVAAIHAIVLAALHNPDAVDMDIYGAFQLCAIGVLAGPVTVKLSDTYFNAPGRNLIFVWTTVILAGLLSLTVEFFRSNARSCPKSVYKLDVNFDPSLCNITCTENNPQSVLRLGAQDNIYLIPSPTDFSFGAATLVCAACCIPAVLSLVSMWNKILQQNWRRAFGRPEINALQDQRISGTNATPRGLSKMNDNIKFYLKMVEIPIFGIAIIAILSVGEKNFFSSSVNFQTEPMQSIGQWGPIVGTGLAAAGSLYALAAGARSKGGGEKDTTSTTSEEHHCTCQHHHQHHHSTDGDSSTPPQHVEMEERRSPDDLDIFQGELMLSPQNTYQSTNSVISPRSTKHLRQTSTGTTKGVVSRISSELARANTAGTNSSKEGGSRHKVARMFEKLGDRIGTPAPGAFDETHFRRGPASDFPEVPGEAERNEKLQRIRAQYNPERDLSGNATPLRRQRSTGSFVSTSSYGLRIEGGPSEPTSPVVENGAGPSNAPLERSQARRATMGMPKTTYLQTPKPRRFTFSTTTPTPPGPPSPIIKVSQHHEDEEEQEPETPRSPSNEHITKKDTNHE